MADRRSELTLELQERVMEVPRLKARPGIRQYKPEPEIGVTFKAHRFHQLHPTS